MPLEENCLMHIMEECVDLFGGWGKCIDEGGGVRGIRSEGKEGLGIDLAKIKCNNQPTGD